MEISSASFQVENCHRNQAAGAQCTVPQCLSEVAKWRHSTDSPETAHQHSCQTKQQKNRARSRLFSQQRRRSKQKQCKRIRLKKNLYSDFPSNRKFYFLSKPPTGSVSRHLIHQGPWIDLNPHFGWFLF